MKNITFNEWLKGKNFNSNVESILRKIDKGLSNEAGSTYRGNERISFCQPNSNDLVSVIAIWQANDVKLQVKANDYPEYSNYGFVMPSYKKHFDAGFMELRINDASQFDEKLKRFLIKGLK
ncbi:hypothetical protein OAK67_02735 [Crocinitomicaceae bacterium]|jgi:hypothetical protein|nr:hypothetical protein [Crocinitomicaceae bacterium]